MTSTIIPARQAAQRSLAGKHRPEHVRRPHRVVSRGDGFRDTGPIPIQAAVAAASWWHEHYLLVVAVLCALAVELAPVVTR